MAVKFSEDIIPLSTLKINPGKVIAHANETHRPVLLTSRGRGVAVVQSLKDYEEEVEQRSFMQAVIQGMMDLEEGREVSLSDAKKRLGLK
ncbi:MAG: type II toxin-antitoxin system Phd/YefM family antitoxin [Nitrospirae bacterium]|nr:type II toxin-antitoxin system Phd/YefM family antitoxin [Nitrospirota bacterium]